MGTNFSKEYESMGASDESVEVRNEGASQWREGERVMWARTSHKIMRGWKPRMRARDSGEKTKESDVARPSHESTRRWEPVMKRKEPERREVEAVIRGVSTRDKMATSS